MEIKNIDLHLDDKVSKQVNDIVIVEHILKRANLGSNVITNAQLATAIMDVSNFAPAPNQHITHDGKDIKPFCAGMLIDADKTVFLYIDPNMKWGDNRLLFDDGGMTTVYCTQSHMMGTDIPNTSVVPGDMAEVLHDTARRFSAMRKEPEQSNIFIGVSKDGICRSGNDSTFIGYDALKHHESIQRTPITMEWVESHKALHSFERRAHPSGNYDWIACLPYLYIRALGDEIMVTLHTGGSQILLEHFTTTQQCDALIDLLSPQKAKEDEQG